MNALSIKASPDLSVMTEAERLMAFKRAVSDYSAARSELSGLGTVVAMQLGPPTRDQRDRLHALGAQHYMAGETLKALAMTLMADDTFDKCAQLLEQSAGGQN